MANGKTWNAEELLAMTPNERDELVRSGLVTDIHEIPRELLDQAKADIRAHITANEATTTKS